ASARCGARVAGAHGREPGVRPGPDSPPCGHGGNARDPGRPPPEPLRESALAVRRGSPGPARTCHAALPGLVYPDPQQRPPEPPRIRCRARRGPPAMSLPRRVLAIGAHPDDIELSCAGTLARFLEAGASVHLAVVCRGDRGGSDRGLTERRRQEARSAAEVLG